MVVTRGVLFNAKLPFKEEKNPAATREENSMFDNRIHASVGLKSNFQTQAGPFWAKFNRPISLIEQRSLYVQMSCDSQYECTLRDA